MKSLMLSAVVLGVALVGCDYGDPRLPFPDSPTDEQLGAPVGGDGADAGEQPVNPDAGAPDVAVPVSGTIIEIARSNPDLALFVRALDLSGMTAQLSDVTATVTVFAPDNAAFAAMLTELGVTRGLEGMSAAQLQTILRYHVLSSRVSSTDALAAASQKTTLQAMGGKIEPSVSHEALQLDKRALVTRADLRATNGVMHVINHVLLPSITDVLSTTSTVATFEDAVAMTGDASLTKRLDDDTQSLTVFAPSNRSFEKLFARLAPAGINGLESFRADQLLPIAKYHVAEGKKLSTGLTGGLKTLGGMATASRTETAVTIDKSKVSVADIYCSNGVIHFVDGVLMPSITDVMHTDERFHSLSAAITAADSEIATTRKVGDALDSSNSFTFFAPSNQAFSTFGSLPVGLVQLTNTLFFHAVPGSPMYSTRLAAFEMPTEVLTALDKPLTIVPSQIRVTLIDGAGKRVLVTQTDLFAGNGVIQVIDQVLTPSP